MQGPAVCVWWSRTAGDVRERARALLVQAAAHTLGCPAETIRVGYEPGGRPCLVQAPGGPERLHIGASHCIAGAIAVVASRLAPVGVDIEVVRPLPVRRLATRWMRPEEAAWVAGQPEPERVEAFLRLWTFKEAVGKAYGIGLRRGGLRRSTPPEWPAPELRAIPDDTMMTAAAPATPRDIVLAVACASRAALGGPVQVREVSGG